MFRRKPQEMHFTIPTSWNQLNEYQRFKIADIVYNSQEKDPGVYFAALYYLFVSKPWWTLKGFRENRRFYKLIKQVPISEYIQYCEFIFKDLKLTKFPRILKVNGKDYYGPAERLANLTMDELAMTYQFYFNWIVNRSEIDLDRLVTALYRPYSRKTVGDVREAFSEHTLHERSGILPKVPIDKKIAIGFAYKASTELIFSRYKDLFPPAKTVSKDKKPKFNSFVPMMRVMAMGENLPLGDYEKVRKTNVNMFFDIAQETIRMDIKRQMEMEKLKRRK